VGQQFLDMLSQSTVMGMNHRASAPSERFLDVSYKKLTADPIGTVRNLYSYYGLAYSAAFEQAMARYLAENRQHKRGRHTYSLEQFGLTPARVDEAFVPYKQTYAAYL
jgi:hypothetical protein